MNFSIYLNRHVFVMLAPRLNRLGRAFKRFGNVAYCVYSCCIIISEIGPEKNERYLKQEKCLYCLFCLALNVQSVAVDYILIFMLPPTKAAVRHIAFRHYVTSVLAYVRLSHFSWKSYLRYTFFFARK